MDSLRYKDKVVIITGGSKGIGEGCVRIFVREGAKVAFCARGETDGKVLENEMNKTGPGEAAFTSVDVRDEEQIKAFIDLVVAKYGRLDCLINNAGTHPPCRTIDDTSAEDLRELFELNVTSYFLMAKYCLPHLRKTRGTIINDSSLVAKIGQRGAVSYVMSKGAIDRLSRALAVDEAAHGVRVNNISPGSIWTPLWSSLAGNTEQQRTQNIKEGEDTQLFGRMGTIQEIGEACLFLAAEATFCTGIDLLLSGGAELDYGCKNKGPVKTTPVSHQ